MAKRALEQDVNAAILGAYGYVEKVVPKLQAIGITVSNETSVFGDGRYKKAQISQLGLPLIKVSIDLESVKPPINTAMVVLTTRRRESPALLDLNLSATEWQLRKFQWKMWRARRRINNFIARRSK